MRVLSFMALAFCSAACLATPTRWLVSPLGDARKAWAEYDIPPDALWNGGKVGFELPPGEWNDVTATFWIRNFSTNSAISAQNVYKIIGLTYCPEAIQRNLPDALDGAAGWGVPGGVAVSGSLAIPLAMEPHWSYTNRVNTYTNRVGAATRIYQHGAYTVNAIVTNTMGLSVGGVEHTLTPGTNVFNTLGGASPYVTLTGSGNVQVGISRLYWHQYFDRINGVAASEDRVSVFTASSIVTNEMVFVSCRIHLAADGHWTRDDMVHWDGNDVQGKTVTNSLPLNPSCRALSSKGDYKAGLIGLGHDDRLLMDIFDFRVHTWWLDDSELMRTMQNGKQELLWRGIPKNKEF